MHSAKKLLAALVSVLVLTQCSGSTNTETTVTGSARGLAWTLLLMQNRIQEPKVERPGALLGLHVTAFLLYERQFKGSTNGVMVSSGLLNDTEFERTESYAILEDLGVILQVEVPDMLNRSQSRSNALDAYVSSLENQLEIANNQKSLLEQDYDAKRDEERAKRREVSALERSQREALRDQDYGSAGNIQQQIIEEETLLAGLETQGDELRSTINLFERLIDIGIERATAMKANRDALIAGVTVTDIPGVEDLGVLMEGRGARSRSFFEGL